MEASPAARLSAAIFAHSRASQNYSSIFSYRSVRYIRVRSGIFTIRSKYWSFVVRGNFKETSNEVLVNSINGCVRCHYSNRPTVPEMRSPGPINLSLGWTEILAGIVVLTTALVLDFMAFRVSLLKKEQSAALKEQEQAATSSPSPPSETPGSGAEVAPSSATASTSNSSNGDGNGRGVAAAAAGLPVRPQRRPLSTAEQNRVHLKRAAILASWILGAVVCHRYYSRVSTAREQTVNTSTCIFVEWAEVRDWLVKTFSFR